MPKQRDPKLQLWQCTKRAWLFPIHSLDKSNKPVAHIMMALMLSFGLVSVSSYLQSEISTASAQKRSVSTSNRGSSKASVRSGSTRSSGRATRAPRRAPAPRQRARQAAPRRSTPKRATPRQVSPRRSTPKRVTPRQVSPRRSTPKRVTPRQVSPRRSPAPKATPRQLSPRRSSPKRSNPRVTQPRVRTPRVTKPQVRNPRVTQPGRVSPRVNPRSLSPSAKSPSARSSSARSSSARQPNRARPANVRNATSPRATGVAGKLRKDYGLSNPNRGRSSSSRSVQQPRRSSKSTTLGRTSSSNRLRSTAPRNSIDRRSQRDLVASTKGRYGISKGARKSATSDIPRGAIRRRSSNSKSTITQIRKSYVPSKGKILRANGKQQVSSQLKRGRIVPSVSKRTGGNISKVASRNSIKGVVPANLGNRRANPNVFNAPGGRNIPAPPVAPAVSPLDRESRVIHVNRSNAPRFSPHYYGRGFDYGFGVYYGGRYHLNYGHLNHGHRYSLFGHHYSWLNNLCFSIGWPYNGYYAYYNSPYLSRYGCDYYASHYVRFGRHHLSLYTDLGFLWWPRGHYHRRACSTHGTHYYRIRDCSLCYDDHDSLSGSQIVISHDHDHDHDEPAEDLSGLAPGELSFCEGWAHLSSGNSNKAAEAFYNASLELPSSMLTRFFLGVSLAAEGEFDIAKASIEKAYELNDSLVLYRWDPIAHFGSQENYDALLDTINSQLELYPASQEAWLCKAMILLYDADDSQRIAAANRAVGEFLLYGSENPLVEAIQRELHRRQKDLAPADHSDPAVGAWLLDPNCSGLQSISFGRN